MNVSYTSIYIYIVCVFLARRQFDIKIRSRNSRKHKIAAFFIFALLGSNQHSSLVLPNLIRLVRVGIRVVNFFFLETQALIRYQLFIRPMQTNLRL